MSGVDPLLLPETALAGAILATGAAAFAPITLHWTRRLFPPQPAPRPTWGTPHLLLAGLLWIVFEYLAAGLVIGLADLAEGERLPISLQLVATVVIQATVCAVIVYWARKGDADGLRRLGLRTGASIRAVVTGLVAYAFTFPGLLGLTLLWPWLMERMGGSWAPQGISIGIRALSGVELGWVVALAVIVIPFCEELIFRGFLQTALVHRFGAVRGLLVASAIFALLHGVSQFLPIFALALILGGVLLRTQRLAACWFVHALHNGLQLIFVFLGPELTEAPALVPFSL